MEIGQAIEIIKKGGFVAREGWNGKGVFLWYKPPADIQESWCRDPILIALCQRNGGHVEATGTVCMYTADHKVLTGWLASQTDLLADDWIEVSLTEGS